MQKDLKIIKDKFGENMSKLCRELFPTLLEQEGLLPKLLLSKFESNHFLYDDIIKNKKEDDFKNLIYSLVDVEKEKIEVITVKTPKELLSEAGYILYECKTEEDIQSFKKYYEPNETICTITNGNRLDRCHVFFAVKKNVQEIKRENFPNPQRQDEYGTSVISLQFTKGSINILSIKNRYNHTVNNPDATFLNNLDNIIEGLSESFTKTYGFNIANDKLPFEIPGYVKASDGRYYKYNLEINNVYYCPDNIIIDIDNFEVKRLDKQKKLLIDYFIIDLENKSLSRCELDSFVYGFKELGKNPKEDKIEITKTEEGKRIRITIKGQEPIIIDIDKTNQIIGYENDNIEEIGDNFLALNTKLKSLSLAKVKTIGEWFLHWNNEITILDLPSVENIKSAFLYSTRVIKKILLPKAKSIGFNFLQYNTSLEYLYIPNIEKIRFNFLQLHKSNVKLYIKDPTTVQSEDSFFLERFYPEIYASMHSRKEK